MISPLEEEISSLKAQLDDARAAAAADSGQAHVKARLITMSYHTVTL